MPEQTVSFDDVYAEAYLSGTGLLLDDPEVEVLLNEYVAIQVQEQLERLTTPDDGENSEVTVLSHPSHAEFSEDDLQRIAKIKFLGTSLIRTARIAILRNNDFSTNGPKNYVMGLGFNALLSKGWRDTGGRQVNYQELSKDPDVASPLRLRNWPDGEYVNCLGISIATAALCEIAGMKYVYGNEIRTAQPFINDQHAALMGMVSRMSPGFFTNPIVIKSFENADYFHKTDKIYKDILFKIPEVLKKEQSVPREFHHYVICQPGDGNICFYQFDPYAIVNSALVDKSERPVEEYEALAGSHAGAVVTQDHSETLNSTYEIISRALAVVERRAAQFANEFKGEAFKSKNIIAEIRRHNCATAELMFEEIYGPEGEKDKGYSDNQINNTTYSVLVALAEAILPDGEKAAEDHRNLIDRLLAAQSADKRMQCLDNNRDQIIDLQNRLMDSMQNDLVSREHILQSLRMIPLITLMRSYRELLGKAFSVRLFGTANAVHEVAEPEFMIGAMYLNHYATWRKDGRVNVARQLARLSPSQLLWQAAHQDGPVDDPRVQAVGEVIRGLKPRLLHPLVNIARGLIQR